MALQPLNSSAERAAAIQRGLAQHRAGRVSEAEAEYMRVLAAQPDHPDALHLLGVIAHQVGHNERAVELIQRAIAGNPKVAAFHSNLVNALLATARFDEALDAAERAVALDPRAPGAHNNLGTVLKDLGRHDEAIAAHRTSLELRPDYADGHYNLANALKEEGQLQQAVDMYRRAIELKPDYPQAYTNLGITLKEMGLLDEAFAAYRRALDLKPDFALAHSNLLFSLEYDPGRDRAAIFAEYKRWDALHAAPLLAEAAPHGNLRDPDKRLRVGLVSGNFRRHPVGFFITSILEAHNKSLIELFCYSTNPHSDGWTERIGAAADSWRDVGAMSDAALAALVREDAIDILVELSGHASGHRLLAFARKPAPVQVKWVGGQFNTTGMAAIDYFLTDRVESPPGDEDWYVEQLVRLPDAYTCYTPPDYAPDVGPLPALERGHVTFGCFNNLTKINPQVVAVWSEILQRVEGSRLVLKTKQLGDDSVAARYREMFEGHGIAADRVDLLGQSEHAELLALYGGIDIALDPFRYCGCLSTCEALWMGVPVATLPGETFAERHSASFLTVVGLDDWIVGSTADYVDLVERRCADLDDLAGLRDGLRARVRNSPLCDYDGFARNLEAAYRDMWRTWCATPKPAIVNVNPPPATKRRTVKPNVD